jgi:hypothetical protein
MVVIDGDLSHIAWETGGQFAGWVDIAEEYNANLVTGMQLEYYPDYEQMTYLEPQLGDYQGFVFEESDFYLETLAPNKHPWGFYYWSPDIMASFVNEWNTNLNMQENKSVFI